MNNFTDTGFDELTMTATYDPSLKVIEINDGHDWLIKFYAGELLIDSVNMLYCKDAVSNKQVLMLPVHNMDGVVIGTVEQRIQDAIDLLY